MPSAPARFRRLGETARLPVTIRVDGEIVTALEGDSLLTAILTHSSRLRRSEFSGKSRSGFCLMAACQDCWVWSAEGERLRACDTPVRAGLSILTDEPDPPWLSNA